MHSRSFFFLKNNQNRSNSYEPTLHNSNEKPCYYDKLLHKLSFDWLKEFEELYSSRDENKVSRFGIVKINEMSHDYLERLFWIDEDLKQLLENLFTESFLNNTLFFLMGKTNNKSILLFLNNSKTIYSVKIGDHGHRFHNIRQTFIGKLEEKLPMFGMMVPQVLTNKNQLVREHLRENTKSSILLQ